jgi:hypothetical protein
MYLFFDEQKNEALIDLKRAVKLNPKYRKMAINDNDFEKLWEYRDFKDIITANQM